MSEEQKQSEDTAKSECNGLLDPFVLADATIREAYPDTYNDELTPNGVERLVNPRPELAITPVYRLEIYNQLRLLGRIPSSQLGGFIYGRQNKIYDTGHH